MAHNRSAEKRIRQTSKRREENRYYLRTMRTFVKRIRNMEDKEEAKKLLPKVTAMIDKLVKRKQIHKNKAANLKSSVMKAVNKRES
ncbi:MAG: 30S ribosomal protein S20 [Bacteroidetes bacterium SW_11_45_7]|jgi:small subunit ribosomal protein S20|nr:MAG: 30S ribosomal protein S20 [Bacteroidetes bacterium SW_11_45_7]